MTNPKNARLALSDGSLFRGSAFGATDTPRTVAAEVVFNTAMSGYQESLTDPSYAGQILVETAPLVGNTGTNPGDVESARVQVSGFVVRELANLHSNYRADNDLSSYLARHGVKAEAHPTASGKVAVGDVILSRASDLGADLIVMGAWGHSRLREIVLGGATRSLLEQMTVPVLLSH